MEMTSTFFFHPFVIDEWLSQSYAWVGSPFNSVCHRLSQRKWMKYRKNIPFNSWNMNTCSHHIWWLSYNTRGLCGTADGFIRLSNWGLSIYLGTRWETYGRNHNLINTKACCLYPTHSSPSPKAPPARFEYSFVLVHKWATFTVFL